jgi:hypothetical protein
MNKNNAARVELTTKQQEVLNTIAAAAESLADNHVERKPLSFSPDVFNALKKKELVGAHGKFIWVTKAGMKQVGELNAATTTTEVLAEINKHDAAKDAKKPKQDGPTLDWAYRRLRRQALLFFGQNLKRDGLTENLKKFREDLEAVPSSYKALRDQVEMLVENDSKLHGDWDSFMEEFFGHEIHPGSRSK